MPKRKTAPLATDDANIAARPINAIKAGRKVTESVGKTAGAAPKFKYSNAESLEKEPPKLGTVCWPKDEDEDEGSEDDEDENEERGNDESEGKKGGEEDEGNEPSREVTDKGFPITLSGLDQFVHMMEEQDKRDQDMHSMHIYNDWNGWGMTEMLENMLADFNKVLFKKDVSPVKKWAYVEGLVAWFTIGELHHLMMNEDGDSVKEVFDVFGTMLVTAFEMLSEHNLIREDSPIPNVGIVTLLVIDFLEGTCNDFDMEGVCEIVRAADKFGVKLVPREEVSGVGQGDIDLLRQEYEEAGEEEVKKFDWKSDYATFKRDHPGGKNYDITKMSKAEKASHSF